MYFMPVAIQQVTWVDIFLWSVMVGNRALSEMLWCETREPLRASLMASRLCRRCFNETEPPEIAWDDAAVAFENVNSRLSRTASVFPSLSRPSPYTTACRSMNAVCHWHHRPVGS